MQFQSEVVEGGKNYVRYVNDFVSYHLPCFTQDEERARLHSMHINSMFELLMERRDLVDMFFTKNTFDKSDYKYMYKLFNTTEHFKEQPKCLAFFDDRQISLITHFVNEVKLFKKDVTEKDMQNFFDCTLEIPLQASSNRRVTRFLDSLREEDLLPFSWQKIIEDNGLIASAETNRPMNAKKLGSTLSQAKKHSGNKVQEFVKLSKQLKEMKEK